MPEENVRTIVPAAQGGWNVRTPHARRASAWCASEAEARMRARQILRNTGGGKLLILGPEGAVIANEPVSAPERAQAKGRSKLVRHTRTGYGRTSC
jgi:hypothetical protein